MSCIWRAKAMSTVVRNRVALILLVLAKIVGVIGLVVPNRTLGGALLVLDGVMLAGAVALCVLSGRKLAKREDAQRDLLAQMLREGTAELFLQETRTALRKARETPSTRVLPEDAPRSASSPALPT